MTDKYMTLRYCQNLAKAHKGDMAFKMDTKDGFLSCKWLDAWFGFFTAEGHDGFFMVSDFEGDDCRVKIEEQPK